ncbi:MAG: phosphohistidine phosphatase SixA [Acidobacteriota bacterium]|nr:phosphohistidine phosphatase SixA [Acidobacteriota bacterium]
MELYLFRHGIAEDGKAAGPDSERQLTDEGRKKAAEVARLARKSGVTPSLILTSPYIRARQTARVAAEEMDYEGQIVTIESLVPHGSPEAVWADIRDYSGADSVLLAGHEPLMSRLVAFFLNAPSLRIEMKKAAMVRIDIESARANPHGILRWMIIPKLT